MSSHHAVTNEVLRLFTLSGDSQYGGECVTQLEHALQAAFFAERAGASASLVTAALLHDVGHLLHDLPDDAPEMGIDDRHEELAARWLENRFGPEVVEPARMHVAAKRYLCATDADYFRQLSPPSVLSLKLQGGPMSALECSEFEQNPHFQAAVDLRRWDDAAKIEELQTPPVTHYASYIDEVLMHTPAGN